MNSILQRKALSPLYTSLQRKRRGKGRKCRWCRHTKRQLYKEGLFLLLWKPWPKFRSFFWALLLGLLSICLLSPLIWGDQIQVHIYLTFTILLPGARDFLIIAYYSFVLDRRNVERTLGTSLSQKNSFKQVYISQARYCQESFVQGHPQCS